MRILKDIQQDNFLFGGLVYHHKEIIDPEERDKQFQKLVAKENGQDIKTIEDVTITPENIYSLAAALSNIKNSQSLSKYAMDKTMKYFGNETESFPIDDIYNSKDHDNAFIDNGIKIIDSDMIIFISMKGVLGGTYDSENENQRLAIRYEYDKDLNIYIGEVFDLKLYEDFLNYKKYIGDMK